MSSLIAFDNVKINTLSLKTNPTVLREGSDAWTSLASNSLVTKTNLLEYHSDITGNISNLSVTVSNAIGAIDDVRIASSDSVAALESQLAGFSVVNRGGGTYDFLLGSGGTKLWTLTTDKNFTISANPSESDNAPRYSANFW